MDTLAITIMSLGDDINIDYAGGGKPYDPTASVPYWHQNMELITICVCNALTLLLITIRLMVRWRRVKALRRDDIWILVAGVLLVFPHWTSQIATNRYGSGLHSENVPDDWLIPEWLVCLHVFSTYTPKLIQPSVDYRLGWVLYRCLYD